MRVPLRLTVYGTRGRAYTSMRIGDLRGSPISVQMAAILPGAKRPTSSGSSEADPHAPSAESGGRRSGDLDDRVAKLRELRESLGRYQDLDRAVSAVPAPGVRRWLYTRLGVEGARFLDAEAGMGVTPPAEPEAPRRKPVSRAGFLLVVLVVVAGLAAVWSRTQQLEAEAASVESSAVPVVKTPIPAVAEGLAKLPDALQPQSIWLVESKNATEEYSNGLRIDTTYAVKGDPRRHRVFELPDGRLGPVSTEPVGILFHTSESDIWALEEGNNDRLRHNSQNLLKYIQRNKCYHYVIDRFGRVYRVVDEGTRANHAGFGVWRRDNHLYMNLNSQFLGICFETRWEGGKALPITKAQLTAGRDLTDYLRTRYKILPEMCTAHGLTSVNPRKHLIGHHIDWARGFPFDAFGLPDQYNRPDPAVVLFGFGYDEEFLSRMMGDPWTGVHEGERAFEQEARQQGRTVDDLRRERRLLYDRWIAEQAQPEEENASEDAARPSAPSGAQPKA
jgi:N-acetylmuramoyl-L-alanine amidase